ncbi:MAG: response regulator, partial [Myxococcota bacterium]
HGLGLAAVLGIVKANAGAIQVNSAPGHGTSISIYLPSTNQPISTDAPVRPNSEHTAVQGTVLVVDDEASVADVCRLLLERMGLDVIVVSTGQEAIEITATQSFELVVLDLTMPHIGGIEVLKAIRTNRPAQAVMLSSGYTEDDVGQFLDTKTTFLRKPYTAGEFKHAVAEFLTATTTEADKAPSKKVTE